MNRRGILEAAVRGRPAGRVPVGAWGHFYVEEVAPDPLADALVEFRRRYDWDFVKVHARASYHVEGWGFAYRPSADPAVGHKTLSVPIAAPADWRKLRPLGLDAPALAEQFRLIDRIRAGVGDEFPIIMTVFSPLDVAEKLVDRDPAILRRHIEESPDDVRAALGVFAETFAPFVGRLAQHGVDGIYFSTKWVNANKLSAADYARLARPFDLAVLAEAKGLWCRMMHVCEDGVDLEAVADYPVDVIHWDNRAPANPSLADGRRRVGRAVGGGVDARTLATGTPDEVYAKARAAVDEMEGRGLILGPGCSVMIAKTPPENLHALRRAAG